MPGILSLEKRPCRRMIQCGSQNSTRLSRSALPRAVVAFASAGDGESEAFPQEGVFRTPTRWCNFATVASVNQAKDAPVIQEGKNKAWPNLAQTAALCSCQSSQWQDSAGPPCPQTILRRCSFWAVPCTLGYYRNERTAEEREPEERRRPFTVKFGEATLFLSSPVATEGLWRNPRPRRPSGKIREEQLSSSDNSWSRVLACRAPATAHSAHVMGLGSIGCSQNGGL